jgi:hypothetical protein
MTADRPSSRPTAGRVRPRRALAGLALLLALVANPGAATPGAATPGAADAPTRERPGGAPAIGLDYGLYLGGLQALEFSTRVELAEDAYAIRFQARTDGFIGTLFPFVIETRSTGTRAEGRLHPQRYATANRWSDNDKRWVRLSYPAASQAPAEGAVPAVAAQPPNGEDDRPVVPESARGGTVDPISAIYGLVLQEAGRCDGTRRIFDGRRRYDLVAADLGAAEVPESSYAIYDGPARKCRLSIEKVDGFWTKHDAKRRYPDTVEVWLAPVAEDLPPLPVRMEATTLIGAMRVHLTGIRRGAQAEWPSTGLFPIEEVRGGG